VRPFSRTITIRFAHCDAAGIIFYPQFFALVNEMVEDWFATMGHSFKALHVDARKGVPSVVFDAEFMKPVRLGDKLTQTLSVSRLGKASCTLRHEAKMSGKLVARFSQTIVFTDLNAMKAEPWPADLRAAMARYAEPVT
jgi:4-hydroxybenzoyl-CoA thioesterase